MAESVVVDLMALSAWMDRHGLGSGDITNARALSGGTQNILLRFHRAGRDYVLRRPSAHPRPGDNETMRREARLLGALAGTGVPHPRLIASCGEELVLGAAFYLMEPVEGFNATTSMPALHAADPAIRRAMGFSAVDGAAALAAVDYMAVGLEGFGKTESFLERQVSRWQRQLEGYAAHADWPGPRDLPYVDSIAAWLEANRPRTFEPGIMHGDYHLANLMFRHDGAGLAAIVDWELATVGDPLLDLGWLLATWPEPDGRDGVVAVSPWDGFPDRAALIERYAAVRGRAPEAIGWYAVLACFKLGVLLEGTYARSCAGAASAEIGARLHALTILLFRRAMSWTTRPPH